MPRNENPSLRPKHTGYVAKSGGGKSQALKQNQDIPKTGVRVLAWDPNRDHTKHCKSFRAQDFASFANAAAAKMKSGGIFRLAYAGDQSEKDFDKYFCRLALACLDGNKPLYILIEELAAVQLSVGRASPNLQTLCNQSRKYGGIIHWTTQTPAEIPKTVMKQTENFFIGNPGKFSTKSMDDRLAMTAECSVAELKALKELQFYKSNSKESELIQLKYKKI